MANNFKNENNNINMSLNNYNISNHLNNKNFLSEKNYSYKLNNKQKPIKKNLSNINNNSNINNINNNNLKNIEFYSDDENENNLSEIANEIINSFGLTKNMKKPSMEKKYKKIEIKKQNKDFVNKKINLKKMNERKIPQNYTFKTVFVNNFCVVPMNTSYFLKKNNTYKELNNSKNIITKMNNTENNEYYINYYIY